jgi:uncharacterized protein YdhG (YjbR/CyaY superfamily)
MDTNRLASIVERMIEEDVELKIQSKIQSLLDALNGLAANPQDPGTQLGTKNAQDALENAVAKLGFEADPTYASYVRALSGEKFFSSDLTSEVVDIIAANAMTPAVARDSINTLVAERREYVGHLSSFSNAAIGLGIDSEDLEEGQSQIGFRIPREIFSNELKGWTAELDELRNIIRPFSEIAVGGAESIQIGEISTTDPIIFLILKPVTVALIAKSISWTLDQWKKVEEIRKLRAETAKINANSSGALDLVVQTFDTQIQQVIEDAISKHARELVPQKSEPGRHNEQFTDMTLALRSLVARVERGMTVELKFIPHADGDEQADSDDESGGDNAMADIAKIVPKLIFPEPTTEPVIALPNRTKPASVKAQTKKSE